MLSAQFIIWRIDMNKKEKELNLITKILDKLEQRIAKLEKVLESHAKCIGEMRENKDE